MVAGLARPAGRPAAGRCRRRAPLAERGEQVAAALASSLAAQPVLCDLIGAQAAVLERNVSPRVAADFKRAAHAKALRLAELVEDRLGELGADGAMQLVAATAMSVGGIWAHTHPSAAMLAAYEADPVLATMRLDFTEVLRELLAVLIAGLLARGATPISGLQRDR